MTTIQVPVQLSEPFRAHDPEVLADPYAALADLRLTLADGGIRVDTGE